MSEPKFQGLMAITVAIALGLALAIAAALLNSREGLGFDAAGATPEVSVDLAPIGETIRESRALMSALFVGRVVSRDGDVNVGDELAFLLPVYTVTVETSLKGEAHGQVRLAVTPVGDPAEHEGSPVQIGDRYLFAAEGPDEGLYWIDEGLGSLVIANDEQAAAVIAEYEHLIATVEPPTPPHPPQDPCHADVLIPNPTLDIDPIEGRAGRTVRVSANQVSGPLVYIYWIDFENRVGKGEVRADCGMNV
ncbi:MAG: hypothetical protein ACRDJC_12510 [Thermomicrobiales bacterium]